MSSDSDRPPGIRTIADNLGLGTNTVSRALRGGKNVRRETLELVIAEAQRIGYVPNSVARSLVMGRTTKQLGLVITNPSNPFYSELISAIERRCRQLDYSLHLMASEENPLNEERAADVMLQWQIRGAIIVPSQVSAAPWQRMAAAGTHLVCLNRPVSGLDADLAGVDYEQGAYDATTHLIDSGYWPIKVFEEDLLISTIKSRLKGIRRAVRNGGGSLTTADIIRVVSPRDDDSTLPWLPRSAYDAAVDLVPHLASGTGIIAGTDLLALGIHRAANDCGRAVPDDIGIVGQGDYPFSEFLTPALTSLHPPASELGVRAVDMLIERISGGTGLPTRFRKEKFPAVLRVRESTRRNSAGSS